MRKRLEWTLAASIALAACSDDRPRTDSNTDGGALHDRASDADDDGGSIPALCSHGDAIELGMWTSGGAESADWSFMHPFGATFALIDGKCHYFASSDALDGIAFGTLPPVEADQLVHDLGLSQIASFSQYMDQGCPDASTSVISDGMHRFGCSCGCDAAAPPDLARAEAASTQWIKRLGADVPNPWPGPVRVVAIDLMGAPSPVAKPQAWPLESSIGDVVVADETMLSASPDTAGKVFDSSEDTAALRALRSAAKKRARGMQTIVVSDKGKNYLLYVRDELPSWAIAEFHEFER